MAIAVKNKKQTAVAKKRSGNHHRKGKLYRKAYWPYLPMLLIVLGGVFFNSLLYRGGHVLGDSTDLTAAALLTTTNADRQTANLPPLSLNAELMSAAQSKANDMAARDYWSHDTPEGKTPWSFITAAGYDYQAAGENLAYGFSSASATLTAWMNSPDHRANILDDNYQNVGFGIASSADYQNQGPEVIIVAMYAEPVVAAAHITFSVPPPTAATSSTPPSETPTRLVSRLTLLPGGNSGLALLLICSLGAIAMTIFVIRHGLRLQRLLVRGEVFVVKHPLFDSVIVAICTISVLLTRTAGFIR